MTNQQKVEQFMRAAGEPIRDTPGIPADDEVVLRDCLISEEKTELSQAMMDDDLESIADAIGDLLYVVYGTASAYGLDAQAIFDEVHRSNMTKFIDGYKRPDGKWVKGPSWTPPNFEFMGLSSKVKDTR